MVGEKSRPANNSHCFTGVGRAYWLAKARGHQPAAIHQGPQGSRVELEPDTDSYAIQNGGLERPQETNMPPGVYYRFFGTINHNRYGAAGSLAGNWWLDFGNYQVIRQWAEERDISLARAARQLIVIPDAWHDCGYVGKAVLRTQLRAYVGKGKPAAGGVSPHSAQRDKANDPVSMAPAHLEMKQWFVPGTRQELARYFEPGGYLAVIEKGRYL